MLPCDVVPKNHVKSSIFSVPQIHNPRPESYQDCPDSLVTGKFFVQGGEAWGVEDNSLGWDGKARCESFSSPNSIHHTTLITKKFNYGLSGDDNWGRTGAGTIERVLTKPGVGHVHGASLHEGYIAFKRSVYHPGESKHLVHVEFLHQGGTRRISGTQVVQGLQKFDVYKVRHSALVFTTLTLCVTA